MDALNNSFPEISGSSREEVSPLLQSKPCVFFSDSNIKVCEKPTSLTLASATSSDSQSLPASGSPLSLQSREHRALSTSSFSGKRAVESTTQSENSDTDISALHPPLDNSDAERLQRMSPSWRRRDSTADVSSSGLQTAEVSSPWAKPQEISYEDTHSEIDD